MSNLIEVKIGMDLVVEGEVYVVYGYHKHVDREGASVDVKLLSPIVDLRQQERLKAQAQQSELLASGKYKEAIDGTVKMLRDEPGGDKKGDGQ